MKFFSIRKASISRQKRPVLVSWAVSYMLIFFIPILVSCLVLKRSNDVLVDEIIRSNTNYASQIRASMDAVLRETMGYAKTAARSDELLAILKGSSANVTEYRMAIVAAVDYLTKTSGPQAAIREIYVFTQEGGMLNRSTFYDPVYSEKLMRRSAFPYEQYCRTVQTLSKDQLVYLRAQQGGGLYYLCFPDLHNLEAVPGVFVVEFDADALTQYLAGKGMDNTGIIVLGPQGDCVFANMDADPDYLAVLNRALEQGGYEFEYGGQYQTYSCLDSQVSSLRYAVVTPSTVVLSTARDNLRLIAVGLCLTVIAGALVIYLLLRHNYRPIGSILDDIGAAPMVYGSNEYVAIKQTIDRTMQQNKQFSDALSRHNALVCQSILMALLRGRIYYDTHGMSLEKWCASYGVHFPHSAFIVVLIGFETTSRQELEAYSLERAAVLETLEHTLLQKFIHYTTDAGGVTAVLINEPSMQDSDALLREGLRQAYAQIEENFSYSFYCAVSHTVQGFDAIHTAYTQASAVLDYAILSGQTEPLFYGDTLWQAGASLGAYDDKAERQLLHNIRLGLGDSAREQLEALFAPAQGHAGMAPELMRCMVYDVAAALARLLENEQAGDPMRLIRLLDGCAGLGEMLDTLYSQVDAACQLFAQNSQGRGPRMIQEALDYIRGHYHDADLNVNTLADTFGLSPAYFSRMFYEQTGVRLLDYLGRLRIDAAKELLAGEQTLQSVAQQTGLRTSANLIRLFKKYEGITPGQFRGEK